MITSTKNPAVQRVRDLIKKPAKRKEQGAFAAEGRRLFFDILESGGKPCEVYATEEFLKTVEIPFGTTPEIVSENVLSAMTETKTPQGIVGVFAIPRWEIKDMFLGDAPMLMILDGVADPGNVGTIFRSFEGAGGNGIILLPGSADPFNGKCVRSTMGSVVRMPHLLCKDRGELSDILKSGGYDFKIYAADMSGEDYTTFDYKGPVAFVIGNEAFGVSPELRGMVTDTLSIPMEGRVESLNAAVSASVLAFNAAANRRSQ